MTIMLLCNKLVQDEPNYWMMVERNPILKEEVGGSIPVSSCIIIVNNHLFILFVIAIDKRKS